MSVQSLKSFDTNTVGQKRLCLSYVRAGFGITKTLDHAMLSWNASTTHHQDQNFPAVDVPLYANWTGTIGGVTQNWGDVIVRKADGSLWSTTYNTAPGHRNFNSIAEWISALGGNASYLGWTEDVNGVAIAHDVTDPAPSGGRIAHSGRATVTNGPLHVRNAPDPSSPSVAEYDNGATFNYDSYIDTNGWRYLSYISNSGTRRYIAQSHNGETYVSGGV